MIIHNGEELTALSCATCLVTFAIPSGYAADFKINHDWLCCPRGHVNFYPVDRDTLTGCPKCNYRVAKYIRSIRSQNHIPAKQELAVEHSRS